MTRRLVVARRFRGPDNSGNGGYTCGLVAGLLSADTVEVTLRIPPPLDTPLDVERDEAGGVRVLDRGRPVAEARPAQLDLTLPEPVGFAAAVAGSAAQPPDPDHPFPECFVCGPARQEGDGLRLHPAPAGGGRVAAPWRPASPERALVWAALDCPGAFAVNPGLERGASVLGRLTARILEQPAPGDDCVVVGWPLGEDPDGRRLHAGTALFRHGVPLAYARAVWFLLEKPLPSGA